MIEIGSHYVCTKPIINAEDQRAFRVGDLVLIDSLEDDMAWIIDLNDEDEEEDTSYSVLLADFNEHFEFKRSQLDGLKSEVINAIDDLQASEREMMAIDTDITQMPQLGQGDEAEEPESRELVIASMKPGELKKRVALTRNAMLKVEKVLAQKQKNLENAIRRHASAMMTKVDGLKGMIKKAEEAIWTINLYLGRDEEIVRLTKGARCHMEDPIHLRQMLLFMDEECALRADEGGIDFSNIEEFDAWVSEPDNLQQVLPERKGIVALRVRRKTKDYGDDPWVNSVRNEENMKTYFLMRNGDNLYRLWAQINAGTELFPGHDAFDDYFTKSKLVWDEKEKKHKSVTTTLKPGTRGYEKAMEQADGTRKHYLRVLLLLQGVLDRTSIFKPYPGDQRINICDRREYRDFLRFIYDDDLVLETGHETFIEWLERINGSLAIGHRIMGAFDTYYGEKKGIEYSSARGYPTAKELYRIEARDENQFVFYYDRGEIWSWERGYHQSKKRASCRVSPHSRAIINFDIATVEEMEYFLDSRASRLEYESMMPLLEAAIKAKKAERKAEKPFELLIVAELKSKHGLTATKAKALAPELMNWWKFKNKTHRALNEDDSKALRMIMKEAKLRMTRETERGVLQKSYDKIAKVIHEQFPTVIYIGHKREREFVALVPMNDENIFVCEQLWKQSKRTGELELKKAEEWKIVDKRFMKWEPVFASPRWDGWQRMVSRGRTLTDSERAYVTSQALFALKKEIGDHNERAKEHHKQRPESSDDEDDSDWDDDDDWSYSASDRRIEARERYMPLVVTHKPSEDEKPEEFYIFHSPLGGITPKKNLLTSEHDEPEVVRVEVTWGRQGRTQIAVSLNRFRETGVSHSSESSYWEGTYHKRYTTVWDHPDNLNKLHAEFVRYEEVRERARALGNIVYAADKSLDDGLDEIAKQKAYREYLADYGDPDLWEDHWKKLKAKKQQAPGCCSDALKRLIERGINVDGMLVTTLMARAKKYGLKLDADDEAELEKLPINLTVKLEEDEDDEEED